LSFTYDIGTDRGKTRLRLADTAGESSGAVATSNPYVFQDDEIDLFLSDGGSVAGATLEGIKVLLMDYARREKSFDIKGVKLDDKGRTAALRSAYEVIAADEGELPTVSVTMPSAMPWEDSFTEPTPS